MTAPFAESIEQHAQELVSDIQEHGVPREPETAYEDWRRSPTKPQRSRRPRVPRNEKQPANEGAPKESKAAAKPEVKSEAEAESKTSAGINKDQMGGGSRDARTSILRRLHRHQKGFRGEAFG